MNQSLNNMQTSHFWGSILVEAMYVSLKQKQNQKWKQQQKLYQATFALIKLSGIKFWSKINRATKIKGKIEYKESEEESLFFRFLIWWLLMDILF